MYGPAIGVLVQGDDEDEAIAGGGAAPRRAAAAHVRRSALLHLGVARPAAEPSGGIQPGEPPTRQLVAITICILFTFIDSQGVHVMSAMSWLVLHATTTV